MLTIGIFWTMILSAGINFIVLRGDNTQEDYHRIVKSKGEMINASTSGQDILP